MKLDELCVTQQMHLKHYYSYQSYKPVIYSLMEIETETEKEIISLTKTKTEMFSTRNVS